MKPISKIFRNFFLLAIVCSAIFYLSLPFIIKRDFLEKSLVQWVEEKTENTFGFEKSALSYFPFLTLVFENTSLEMNGEVKSSLKASKLAFRLRVLPVLFGKVQVSGVEVIGGESNTQFTKNLLVRELNIKDLTLKIRSALNARTFISFSGNVAGISQAIAGEVTIQHDIFSKSDWRSLALDGELRSNEIGLADLLESLKVNLPIAIKEGTTRMQMHLSKKKDDNWLDFRGDIKNTSFIFAVRQNENEFVSPAIDFSLNCDLSWDPLTEEIVIRRSRLNSPVGNLDIEGHVFGGTGEVREMRFTTSDALLEKIPQYLTPLKDMIPYNLGFSGLSDWDVTLQGTWNHLAFHANVDFTKAILTYARYFSKPKDIPLRVIFDSLLKDGEILSGDVSVHMGGVTIKGAVSDYNLRTGEMQLNLITNKFQMHGWEKLLLPFQNYTLQGSAKIMGNWKGNVHQPDRAKQVLNLSIKNGSITDQKGFGIKNIDCAMDYGGMAFILKQGKFDINDSSIQMEFSAYNLSTNPELQLKINSARLVPIPLYEAVELVAAEWYPIVSKSTLEKEKDWIVDLFPAGESVENFSLEILMKDKKWSISDLSMSAFGGDFKLKGIVTAGQPEPFYEADIQIERMDLKRYVNRGGKDANFVEGNLFLNGKFRGQKLEYPEWFQHIEGGGDFLVTRGKILNIDLLKAVSDIPEFREAAPYASGDISFDDMRSNFAIENGKIVTDNLVLVSPTLYAEAKGESTLEGALNHRVDIYLSKDLTSKVMGSVLGSENIAAGQQFGPVVFLLTGSFQNASLRPDPELLPDLLKDLSEKRTHKVLRNFLPEELLFERPSKS